ncbi:MAG: hypothetical protein OXE95_02300 [Chloroflexi bacterium]|nr:hypothetical protein [Chloroflexota bacterium]
MKYFIEVNGEKHSEFKYRAEALQAMAAMITERIYEDYLFIIVRIKNGRTIRKYTTKGNSDE